MQRFLIGSLFILIACLRSEAQSSTFYSNEFVDIPNLNIEDQIKTIEKDNFGFIWIGSDLGLFRYDGNRLETFDIPLVKSIEKGSENFLYVVSDLGFYQLEANKYEPKIDTLLRANQFNNDSLLHYPKSVFLDSNKDVWIGEDRGVVRYKEQGLERYFLESNKNNIKIYRSFSFAEDGFYRLWTTSFSGNLYYFDPVKKTFIEVKLPVQLQDVSALASLDNDELYIGANSGLYRAKVSNSGDLLAFDKVGECPSVSKLKKLHNGLLVATWENGLYWLSSDGLDEVEKFAHPDIQDIAIGEYAVWVASGEYVTAINHVPFRLIKETKNKFIPPVTPTVDDQLLVSDGSKIFKLTEHFEGYEFDPLFDSKNKFFVNLLLPEGNDIWLGTNVGIFKFNTSTGILTKTFNYETGLWVTDMYRDSNGNLWISNNNYFDLLVINRNDELSRVPELNEINFVREDQSGNVFGAGKEAKLYLLNSKSDFKELQLDFSSEKHLPDIMDLVFLQDSMYIATNRGLFSVSNESVTDSVIVPHLIYRGHVNGLAVENAQNLWFSTPKGLWRIEKGEFYLLDHSSGLPSDHITIRSIVFTRKSKLWVSTQKGLTTLEDTSFLSKKAPKPILSALITDQKKVDISGNQLGAFSTEASLEIQFASSSLPKSSLKYEIELIGGSEIIKETNESGILLLYNLEDGDYEARVRLRKFGYDWSQTEVFTFNLIDPWYRTIWFYVLLVCLVAGIVWMLIRWYNISLIRSNEKLENTVRLRTEELNEQKNKIIESQKQLLDQQDQMLKQNETLNEAKEALNKSEIKFLETKQDQLNQEIEFKNKQLTTHALNLAQKNQMMNDMIQAVADLAGKSDSSENKKELEKIKRHFENMIKLDQNWDEFKIYFEQVYTGFYSKLKTNYPALTSNDLRHCALVKLNFSLDNSADLLGVSSESVRISRFRIQKKMDFSSQAAFNNYLLEL